MAAKLAVWEADEPPGHAARRAAAAGKHPRVNGGSS